MAQLKVQVVLVSSVEVNSDDYMEEYKDEGEITDEVSPSDPDFLQWMKEKLGDEIHDGDLELDSADFMSVTFDA